MNHDNSHTEPLVCKPRRGLGAVLRSLAGAPAAWRRRGSFLVLVVGTLAILAVMAVVFTTVGRHDARMQFSADKHDKIADVPNQVADYFATLIGADTTVVTYETRYPNGNLTDIPLQRKISDYPSTDYNARSDGNGFPLLQNNSWLYAFNPTGGVAGFVTTPDLTLAIPGRAGTTNPGNLNLMPTSWRPTTPWLASSEPTYLDYNRAGVPANGFPYQYNHDWAHISNVAPDGRFVNLLNLAPVVGGKRVNNFNAESGVGTDAQGRPRMSQSLSLYRWQDGDVQTSGTITTDFGATLDFNRPAHLDTRQVWLFRPARPTQGISPSDPNFEPNQYADADGDGMLDSRWQELRDARFGVDILHTDGKYRWFVAAHIVDLSSMVNVNTAADPTSPNPNGAPANPIAPQAHAPMGTSPADVDLRRLLTNYDVYSVTGNAGYDGGFNEPNQPATPSGPAATVDNYGPGQNGSDFGYNQRSAYLVGDYGFTSLREALASGNVAPSSYKGFGNPYPPGNRYASLTQSGDPSGYFPVDYNADPTLYDFVTNAWDPVNNPSGRDVTGMRSSYFAQRVAAFQDTRAVGNGFHFIGVFGKDDLFELLARRAVNDPDITSSLEAALGGRDDEIVGNFFPDSTRYDPLRSNRGLSLEHDQRYIRATGAPVSMALGGKYDRTMLHFASDIRQRLTTINGVRSFRAMVGQNIPDTSVNPPRSKFVPGVVPDTIDPQELRIDPRTLLALAEDAENLAQPPRTGDQNIAARTPAMDIQRVRLQSEAINRLFTAYADALLPTSGVPGAWGGPEQAARKTEFYGYQGPELAMHVAGHMAVNMVDTYDKPGTGYHADLDGRYAIPAHTNTPGAAAADFTITPVTGNRYWLNFSITFHDLVNPATAVQIYGPAAPGANGNIVGPAVTMPNLTSGVAYGRIPLQATQFTNLKAGDLSIELQTSSGTESLRGQIFLPAPKPTAYTLLLSSDQTFRNNVLNQMPTGTNPDRFLGWSNAQVNQYQLRVTDSASPMPGLGSGLHPLELPSNRLGSIANGDAISAPAVNIYGIEAQPFISQVASFTVYADTAGSGGDRGQQSEIRIDAGEDFTTAHDLMYRVVAFQLTNPSGEDINLGGVPIYGADKFDITAQNYPGLDQDPSFYYIRLGDGATDHYYKVASLEEKSDANGEYLASPGADPTIPAMTISGITIPAGKTIAVYALSDVPMRILNTRLKTLGIVAGTFFSDPDLATGIPRYKLATTFKHMVEHHLGANRADRQDIAGVYWMPEIDTPSSPVVGGHNPGQVIIPHNTKLFPSTRVTNVTLWRAQRFGDEARLASVQLPTVNYDNTAAPARPVPPKLPQPNDFTNDQLIDRFRLPNAPFDINRKIVPPSGQANGWQPVAGTGPSPPGPLDGDGRDPNNLYMITLFASANRQMNPANMPIGAFPAYCMEPKFAAGWNRGHTDTFNPAALTYADFDTTAGFKGAARNPTAWFNGMTQSAAQMTFIDTAPNHLANDRLVQQTTIDGVTTKKYEQIYPEVCLADNNFRAMLPNQPLVNTSTLRPGDMLLPLGIGPEEMPIDSTGAAVSDLDRRWTTLGEAMALAMGYQATPAPTPDVTAPYFVTPGNKQVLDRGNLWLDSFSPFYKVSGGTGFNPAQDVRVGLEIPLALNILDAFGAPRTSIESLTQATPGLININTGATTTFRAALDMLSPPPLTDPLGNNWWWWQPDASGNKPALRGPSNPGEFTPDIAATVVGYRDKDTSYLRPGSYIPPTPPATTVATPFVDFNDEDATGNPIRPDDALNLDGRSLSAAIVGLHEQPGFRSVGELMASRRRAPNAYLASSAWPCNIDFLGFDNQTPPHDNGTPTPTPGVSGHVGLDPVLYDNPQFTGGAGIPPKIPSMVPNSYKEQLEILNGVIGNVSTRSDYFVVWFQLAGFQKSDLDGLGPNDPLTPSVSRRFVMVVDRSKVYKKGQKADILLFKEVPVDPQPR